MKLAIRLQLPLAFASKERSMEIKPEDELSNIVLFLKWHTEFGHLNRGDMLTSEQHRCSNEKKKF
ncbi:hypothetical protein P4G42_25055 [Shigella boydii]|nr:hypothetical protein [Shigella boydii]